MSDELLPYYNRELSYIRKLGAEFAQTYPKIAGRLRLNADTSDDPHVARMIEAFAYLTARIRRKLDDDFPEISDALLGVVYPHYLAPIPSMAIVQLHLDPEQAELTTGYRVPRGSIIETEPIDGEPCRFQTCYPVALWPIAVADARLESTPLSAKKSIYTSQAAAVLRLRLRCTSAQVKFSMMPLAQLRLYVSGQPQHVNAVYELLCNHTIGVALAGQELRETVALPADCITAPGFGPDEGMLPYSARSFLGYRLLTEYFAFPRKFSFVDVAGLTDVALQRFGNDLEIVFYLDKTAPDLEHYVAAETFRLGCTPIVNLYKQRAEPIHLSHAESEYRVAPDARRPKHHEVYAVDRVVAVSPNNEQVEYQPFYSFKHAIRRGEQKTFWYAARRPAEYADGKVDRGTEVFLTLVDLDFKAAAPADWTLHVETTCCSRDLPGQLPFGGGQPAMRLVAGGPVSKVACLSAPTPTHRPSLRHGAVWRLISHLSLNHLSIVGDPDGAEALREILRLYDFTDTDETRAVIEGIQRIHYSRVVAPLPGGPASVFCRGIEVSIHFDEQRYAGGGLFLFASILEKFLGLYVTINSFSRMVASTVQSGEFRRWPPRAGERVLY